MEKQETFANRLRQVLDENGWSQTELAKRANVSKSSITRYLKGDWEAKQDVIYSIADATGLNEAWLMGYDVPKNKPEKNTDDVINDISQYQAILAWVLDNEDVPGEVKYVIRKELPNDPMDALSVLSYQAEARFDFGTKKLPIPVSEDGLDKEAKEVADAYMNADNYVRFGVRKLLGLEVQNEDIQLAARKSDKIHLVTGPDTDVDI